ncbi:major facilitator superfamily domain-containing protein [Panaeolus papilionaceus]|nr:major facilitator superfamily domain-containing protein [Panaeolus papilionaceus]
MESELKPESKPPTHQVSAFAFLKDISKSRKASVLAILCFALFLDTFNNSSLFSAIPPISDQLNISVSRSAWLLAAYQLTFAALLLISGRVSDLYNPKYVFIVGALIMGAFGLGAGFLRAQIPLIIFRALMGVGGALTIPSAQHLIVHMYPDPAEQAKAISIFGAMGALGGVFGLIIGALFVTFVSWPWVFYFSAIVSFSITAGILVLVPNSRGSSSSESFGSKFKRLDVFGVTLFAISLILFIFALTSGSIDGWGSAEVLAPLIISIFIMLLFFVWEAYTPEYQAALPPKIWRYENIAILIIISLCPFMYWGSIYPMYSWLWETVYGWSPINTGVHFLPIALGIIPAVGIATALQAKLPLKDVISIGFVLIIVGTILLPFGDTKARYWRFTFPGFLLEISGIISGLFVSVLQTGAAAGIAITTSIQTSVEKSHGGPTGFQGRAAGLWFIVAFDAVLGIMLLIFMKRRPTCNISVNPVTIRR